MAQLSISTDTPQPEEQNIYLNFLNIAYTSIYTNIFRQLESWNLQEFTGTLTSGSALTLPDDFFQFVTVRNTSNNSSLKAKMLQEILEEDPEFNSTGDPYYYYVLNRNQFRVYPVPSTVNISIYYTQKVAELTLNTPEEDVQIPPEFHYAIIYSALEELYRSEDTIRSEQSVARIYENAKLWRNKLYSYFMFNQRENLRVLSQDF